MVRRITAVFVFAAIIAGGAFAVGYSERLSEHSSLRSERERLVIQLDEERGRFDSLSVALKSIREWGIDI